MQNASKVIVGVVCGLVALTFVCVLALSPQNSVQAPVNSILLLGEKPVLRFFSVPEANARYTAISLRANFSVYTVKGRRPD